jgi:uncharacterized hydrophobic protein (TIGR00271 family)
MSDTRAEEPRRLPAMRRVDDLDVARMRDQLFFEGPELKQRLSKFWLLLLLAAVIASAGVVSDSTATVIGAMIVAPLMTPILGTMLAVVLADRTNLVRSLGLVLGGAAAVVLIGWTIGLAIPTPTIAETSSQVAGRIHPAMIDLLAALATGAVGSVALARSDISDTLPGVAIAISLVPPLAVVGLTLEAGEYRQSAGALLLFVTNVSAILATGLIVMAFYGVGRAARTEAPATGRRMRRRRAQAVIATSLVVVAVPLTVSSRTIARANSTRSTIEDVAEGWGATERWLVDVRQRGGEWVVIATGEDPEPDAALLRSGLDDAGLEEVEVIVEYVPSHRVRLPGD